MKDLIINTYHPTNNFRQIISHIAITDTKGELQCMTGPAVGKGSLESLCMGLLLKALMENLDLADREFKMKILKSALANIDNIDFTGFGDEEKLQIREVLEQTIFD